MNAGNKILVVDDAISVLNLIEDILVKSGYIVETASSGENAMNMLQVFQPDIILLDIMMKGIDGYEVCQRIRSDDTTGLIKIIMVSSRAMLKERLKGYEVGADDYIVKPFKEEELMAKVRVFTRLKSAEDQLREMNDTLNEQIRVRTEQLIEAEKMAAIGRYAAGIVHNLNNPLQVIMGNAQLLAMNNPDDRRIMSLRKAAVQMKKIIATILSTTHRESRAEYTDIDLNEVIKDQIELLKANNFFKNKVQTELNLNPLPKYRGIYHHFSQSLGNLIKNSIDAMYDSKNRVLSITSSISENIIFIQISDTGHGISKEKMEKIFNPFFTTKPLTANDERPTGTGLGLASTKEMIESYGGMIHVDSQVGKNAFFTVCLPMEYKNKS